jgi:nitrogen-specific signal transduction histidine kinase
MVVTLTETKNDESLIREVDNLEHLTDHLDRASDERYRPRVVHSVHHVERRGVDLAAGRTRQSALRRRD